MPDQSSRRASAEPASVAGVAGARRPFSAGEAQAWPVLSGWMNVVADRLKFFRGVEYLIRITRPSWLAVTAEEPRPTPRSLP